MRIGRQRINWGVNLAWNPNDLFNAYSLIDFDYQERSGVDAIRFQYYTGEMSSIEFAIQPGENIDKSIIAALFDCLALSSAGGNSLDDRTTSP